MRNNFLCYSIIIIMLNTMLIKRCTCRSDDDKSVVGLRCGNMTTLVRDKESNALEVAGHTRLCDIAQNDSSHNTCGRSTGTVLYTTYAWVRETKSMKRNELKSKRFRNTSWNAGKWHRASTEIPAKLITNDGSCVLNFKVRKKETTRPRSVQSLVCSSHSNSSYITTETCLSTCVNSCDLPNRSQHFTPRLKRRRNKANGTIDVFTTLEKPKRTRKRKSNATCEFNCSSYNVNEKCFQCSVKSRKSRGRLLSSINKTSLSTNPKNNYKKIGKNSTKSVDQAWDRTTTTNPKRKLLRQELIDLLRNQSLYHQTEPARKNPFSKTASTVLSNTSFVSHTSWPASRVSPKATFFPPMAQNFLYSEESKVNLCDSGNESLVNEFDEIRLNTANSVAEKLNLLHSKERILYVPRNDSVKWYSRFLDGSTKKEHITCIKKCKTVNEKNIKINNQIEIHTKVKKQRVKALVRESECTLLQKDTTKKSQKSTPFDMYDFFLHQKPQQNPLLELKSTGKQNQLAKSRTQTTKLNLKRKKNLNWKQFLMSPEKINVDEEGPTVNVFSESQEEKQPVVNSSETMLPHMVTLSFKELPDTGECEQQWNQTFPTGLSKESNIDKSNEICTLGSLEAMHLIRQNFSGLLTTRSFLSRLSPFHPLLHPFATKFDNSILPKAEEAKAIVAKFLNESVELHDDSVSLETKPDITTVCPLERLNELDFSDLSMSYEWKMLYDNARRTTQMHTDMTDLPIELPDTVEAEHILSDFSCPNMFKMLASRRNKVQSESPQISTLSMQEAKHMFGRLGVELFGQQFRININHRAPTKRHKIMHLMVKNKIPDRVLKNKKVEGYVLKMMTEVSPGSQDQEVYVPWQSEESGAVVKLNFNMKLFLSKLCTYLSDWKHKNETRDLPASKKPRESFLLGKPAFFKKRKNALI